MLVLIYKNNLDHLLMMVFAHPITLTKEVLGAFFRC